MRQARKHLQDVEAELDGVAGAYAATKEELQQAHAAYLQEASGAAASGGSKAEEAAAAEKFLALRRQKTCCASSMMSTILRPTRIVRGSGRR